MVTVAERVWAQWREASARSHKPSIVLAFTSSLPPRGAAETLAETCWAVMRERAEAVPAESTFAEENLGHWSLAPSADGVTLLFDEGPANFGAFLQTVVRRLEELNIEGAFDLYSASPDDVPETIDLLEARLRVAGARERVAYANYAWRADADALWHTAVSSLEWCRNHVSEAPLWLKVSTLPAAAFDRTAELTAELQQGLAQLTSAGIVKVTSIAPTGFRSAAIEPVSGRVTLIEGGLKLAEGAWRETLDSLLVALLQTSSRCVYGFVKRGQRRVAAELGWSLADDWPAASHYDARILATQAFENEYAPDAFGIQFLGEGYKGRAPSADGWQLEPLDRGVLLRHAEPARWFAEPLVVLSERPSLAPPASPPVPDVLAIARDDFESILYRDELRLQEEA